MAVKSEIMAEKGEPRWVERAAMMCWAKVVANVGRDVLDSMARQAATEAVQIVREANEDDGGLKRKVKGKRGRGRYSSTNS